MLRQCLFYGFLGDVTLFDGSFVRPRDIEIFRDAGRNPEAIYATVRFIASSGGVVRVEMIREDTGVTVEAEITPERYRELGLKPGDYVSVTPRHGRVFSE